jgi:outer membrane protein OmpA-like peptidoglycan-associated protein
MWLGHCTDERAMRTPAWLMLVITSGCSTVSVEMMTLPTSEIRVTAEATPKDPEPVRLTKIEIEEQIQFATWKAKILRESFEILDKVAATMKEHPELTLVEIQGHTAKANQPDRTRRLSQERAEAVRKYLVKKGVEAERLVAKGYGEDKPVADNETEEGRVQNRRVDFVVLEQEGDSLAVAGGANE